MPGVPLSGPISVSPIRILCRAHTKPAHRLVYSHSHLDSFKATLSWVGLWSLRSLYSFLVSNLYLTSPSCIRFLRCFPAPPSSFLPLPHSLHSLPFPLVYPPFLPICCTLLVSLIPSAALSIRYLTLLFRDSGGSRARSRRGAGIFIGVWGGSGKYAEAKVSTRRPG